MRRRETSIRSDEREREEVEFVEAKEVNKHDFDEFRIKVHKVTLFYQVNNVVVSVQKKILKLMFVLSKKY